MTGEPVEGQIHVYICQGCAEEHKRARCRHLGGGEFLVYCPKRELWVQMHPMRGDVDKSPARGPMA
jgi:hypothetical protein